MHARKNFNERRFSSAILAQQSVDFPAFELKADAFERLNASKTFPNAFQP